ncbi:MAG: response regulator [Caulobacteraceae bacterium]
MFRVLVVDDHPMNRMIGKEIFQYLGCAVETVESGKAALDILRASPFDLVCLDRHMPELGGDDLLPQLSDQLFVVAWSTDTSNVPRRFDGVLSKPISIAAASDVIVAALNAPKAKPSARVPTGSSRLSFA